MGLKTSASNVLKKLGQETIDSVENVIRESDIAAERKLEADRGAQGPEAAAQAAAQVAADTETRAKEAEVHLKIARAAAKSSAKRATRYRKEAERAAARAAESEVDAAATAANATRVTQTAAVDEAEAIVHEQQGTRE
jgi:hypothetical protein